VESGQSTAALYPPAEEDYFLNIGDLSDKLRK
jgi:hypothetical protein